MQKIVLVAIPLALLTALVVFAPGTPTPSLPLEDKGSALSGDGPGDRAFEIVEPAPPFTAVTVQNAPASPLQKERAQEDIARDMAHLIAGSAASESGWSSRVVLVELRPFIEELHELRLKGSLREPSTRSRLYEDGTLSEADSARMEDVDSKLDEDPGFALQLENLLRRYDLMTCETVNAAMRSWLVAG